MAHQSPPISVLFVLIESRFFVLFRTGFFGYLLNYAWVLGSWVRAILYRESLWFQYYVQAKI